MSTAVNWYHVAACLVVPVAWGFAVHVLFERFGSRAGRGRRPADTDVAGKRPSDSEDDFPPEYQI
jgi:hypothetical protein